MIKVPFMHPALGRFFPEIVSFFLSGGGNSFTQRGADEFNMPVYCHENILTTS